MKDAAAAIGIAVEKCGAPGSDGRWYAQLDDGIWDVRCHMHGNAPSCELHRIRIFAHSGRDDDCETCVVTG